MSGQKGAWLPLARTEGLVVEQVCEETLVYDLHRDEVHCLEPALAALWRRCDGRTSILKLAAALEEQVGVSIDAGETWTALERLANARLLAGATPALPIQAASRREWLRSSVIAGFSLLTIVAPTRSDAASCLPINAACNRTLDCCPNNIGIRCCRNNRCANGAGNCAQP
jgi:hypothetical protein